MSVVAYTVVGVPVDPTNNHDAYFREVMRSPVNAASELRAVLPESVVALVDWGVLEPQSASFVSAELQSRYSDVLFRTRLDGHDGFIYLLIEHQSRSDPLMALRILEYVVRIWNHYLTDVPAARSVPAVLPLVVHCNPAGRRWTAAMDIFDLIDLSPGARAVAEPYLPRFRYVLDDISGVDVDRLSARGLTPQALLMLALIKIVPANVDLAAGLGGLVDVVGAVLGAPGGLRDFQVALAYIIRVGDIDPAELEAFTDQLGPVAKEAFVTTAEMLEARGRREGKIEGKI
ncbi:Rpn family recombination-promoting nuclease/putative transposase, partial [Nocardia arizonensis]